MEGQEVARGSGILLAVSSLPSEYGIGTLGDAAFHFVDLLVDLKQKYWQVLPVGPTSFGDSPYQSLSAFAGNPYLIDLDQLAREKLLTPEEIRSHYWGTQKSAIDYAALFENRTLVLQKAFGRFDEHSKPGNFGTLQAQPVVFFEYFPASSASSGFHWILSVPYTVHNLRPSPCFLLQTAEIPVRVRQTDQMLSVEPASCFQRVLHNQWQISVFPSNGSGFPPASEAFLWQADPDQSDKDFRQMPTSSDMGCPQNL